MLACTCSTRAQKAVAISFSIIAALTTAGAIACFVLMAQYRTSQPAHLCDLTTGDCVDRANNDGSVDAWIVVNITVADCTRVNSLQMRAIDVANCAKITQNSSLVLSYGGNYYTTGAFSCRTRTDDPCSWDMGAFEQRDQILIAVGATAISIWIITFTSAVAMICRLCAAHSTWRV
ncbi:hypothetical protein F-S17_0481 [Faustovirus]|nr:hypothetical protein F-S17_0481 [Faustovirus]